MPPEATLSDAEYMVLQVLWELESPTVREIRRVLAERGQQWAPTTVNTLLSRLEHKGYVAADRTEFAHRFRALIGRESLVRQRLQDLADTFCGGQTSPLLLALVEGQPLSSADVQQLRALLDKLEHTEGGSGVAPAKPSSSRAKGKRQRDD